VHRAEAYHGENGLLERTQEGYRITGLGNVVVDQLTKCCETVSVATDLKPLLSYVQSPALIDNIHLFEDAALYEHESSRPYNVEHRVRDIIHSTDERIRGVTVGLGSPTLADAMFERIRNGVPVEWIMPKDTWDYFLSENREKTEEAASADQISVYLTDDISLDFAIYDETLMVIGFDEERGSLGAVAVTDTADALEWAENVFEEIRRDASPLAGQS
jgi:predicted transcriptional regulator